MTDQSPIEPSRPLVALEHFDALDTEFSGALVNVIKSGLANTLIAGLQLHLPDLESWRLTISGDVVASVNEIEQREEGNAYTLERGVGQVGARTINVPDGTFDIVIGAWSFMPVFEVSTPEELINYMHEIGSHLVIHESGHAILHQRGEDSDNFQELATGTKTERSWRKHLAAHIDDFRIEKMTNRAAPSPASNVEGIGATLAHMRNELTESNVLRLADGEAATFRSSTAVNDLVRVMAYLTAELGAGDTITEGMRPEPLPEGWNEYLEEVWDAWSLNLDRLKPADEPMMVAEIASVLTDLCRIVVLWSQSIIGYHFEMHDDGSWTANWSRAIY